MSDSTGPDLAAALKASLRAARAKYVTPAWTGPDSPQGPVPAGTPDRECTVCGTIAPETTMEFEQGGHWMRGTFRCYDTDACDRRASGLYVTGDYDDMERGSDE